VRVQFELLIPGVEHVEEANLSAEMLGVPCNLKECVGTGLQQEIVENPFVVQGERRQFMGESKDNMDVACGQQLLATGFEPTVAGVGLTFRTVPIPAAVIGDDAMSTAGAGIQMAAEGGGTTARDGQQDLNMSPANPVAAVPDKRNSRGAN